MGTFFQNPARYWQEEASRAMVRYYDQNDGPELIGLSRNTYKYIPDRRPPVTEANLPDWESVWKDGHEIVCTFMGKAQPPVCRDCYLPDPTLVLYGPGALLCRKCVELVEVRSAATAAITEYDRTVRYLTKQTARKKIVAVGLMMLVTMALIPPPIAGYIVMAELGGVIVYELMQVYRKATHEYARKR